MSPKNCMVAQSGGPTVAINASLAGVIDGVMRSDMYDTVYGSLNGITGILNNDLTNLSELMQQNSEYLDRLKVTPAMYLGSCRYKLPNYLDDDSSYVFIFKHSRSAVPVTSTRINTGTAGCSFPAARNTWT